MRRIITIPGLSSCSPPWARCGSSAVTTSARTAARARAHVTGNWMWKAPPVHPACGGCWRWSAANRVSIRAGSNWNFLAGIEVTAKAVERQAEAIGSDIEVRQQSEIGRAKQLELPVAGGPAVPVLYIEMDGTGIPVSKSETEGRAGKVDGQPARTREVKLGCIFTQTSNDTERRPVRDEDSTSYVAAVETAEAFGLRLYTEAWRRGWTRAQKKVVIGDGAIWIWNLADQHFPSAIQIVDLYHARQHLWDLSAKLFPDDSKGLKQWIARCLDRLEHGKIEALVKILRDSPPGTDELTKSIANEAEYFER